MAHSTCCPYFRRPLRQKQTATCGRDLESSECVDRRYVLKMITDGKCNKTFAIVSQRPTLICNTIETVVTEKGVLVVICMELALNGFCNQNDLALYSGSSATTVRPGQDKLAPSRLILRESWFVVSCGVRLSGVGSAEVRKPQVTQWAMTGRLLHRKRSRTLRQRPWPECRRGFGSESDSSLVNSPAWPYLSCARPNPLPILRAAPSPTRIVPCCARCPCPHPCMQRPGLCHRTGCRGLRVSRLSSHSIPPGTLGTRRRNRSFSAALDERSRLCARSWRGCLNRLRG
jgi:hypothetical protein